jgi:hypothetical protein
MATEINRLITDGRSPKLIKHPIRPQLLEVTRESLCGSNDDPAGGQEAQRPATDEGAKIGRKEMDRQEIGGGMMVESERNGVKRGDEMNGRDWAHESEIGHYS